MGRFLGLLSELEGYMSKTPEELAEEYLRKMWGHDGDPTEEMHCVSDFIAGYKAGFEIGIMRGIVAMQETMDDDLVAGLLIDYEKLVRQIVKKEMEGND